MKRTRRTVAYSVGALTLATVCYAPAASATGGCLSGPTTCFAATLSPQQVTTGTTDQFTVTLTNESIPQGGQDIHSANITVPAGFTAVTVSQPSDGTAAVQGNTVQLRNIHIDPGASASYLVTATAPSSAGSYTWAVQAENSPNYTSSAFVLDSGNSSLTTTVSAPPADLQVKFGAASPPGQVTAGNSVLFTVQVTNASSSVAESSVSLSDSVTGGGSIQQAPASGSDAGWTCSSATSTASCSYGQLAPGHSTTLLVWVQSPSTVPTTAVSCGGQSVTGICDNVSVSGSQPDPNSSNNTAAQGETVVAPGTCTQSGAVSCGTGFIEYSQPSTVTTGSTANAQHWLVGTMSFPATSSTGGQLYNMAAPSTPGTYCPNLNGGGLLPCQFQMNVDPVPTAYTGHTVTLTMECDVSVCTGAPIGTTGIVQIVKVDGSGTVSAVPQCAATGSTGLCWSPGTDATNGNFTITITGITPGDPYFAGKCYDGCSPAL